MSLFQKWSTSWTLFNGAEQNGTEGILVIKETFIVLEYLKMESYSKKLFWVIPSIFTLMDITLNCLDLLIYFVYKENLWNKLNLLNANALDIDYPYTESDEHYSPKLYTKESNFIFLC